MLIFRQIAEAFYFIRNRSYEDDLRYFETIEMVGKHPNGHQLYRHYDVLNGKAGSLLSHISIMIAVTAFLLANAYPKGTTLDIFGVLLAVEICLYTLLTIPLLTLTFITNSLTPMRYASADASDKQIYMAYLKVWADRRRNFYFSFIVLNILNAIFVLTVVGKYGSQYFF